MRQKRVLDAYFADRVELWKFERAAEMRRNPTPAEMEVWNWLENDIDGQRFGFQVIFAGYILDFYCPALKLAIELDGEIHESQATADKRRDKALAKYGVKTIRFDSDFAVRNPEMIIRLVRRHMDELARPAREAAEKAVADALEAKRERRRQKQWEKRQAAKLPLSADSKRYYSKLRQGPLGKY